MNKKQLRHHENISSDAGDNRKEVKHSNSRTRIIEAFIRKVLTRSGIGKRASEIPKEVQSAGVPA